MSIKKIDEFKDRVEWLKDNVSHTIFNFAITLAEDYAKYRLEEIIDDHFPEASKTLYSPGIKFNFINDKSNKVYHMPRKGVSSWQTADGNGFIQGQYHKSGLSNEECSEVTLEEVVKLKNEAVKNRKYDLASQYRDIEYKLRSTKECSKEKCKCDESFTGDSLDHKTNDSAKVELVYKSKFRINEPEIVTAEKHKELLKAYKDHPKVSPLFEKINITQKINVKIFIPHIDSSYLELEIPKEDFYKAFELLEKQRKWDNVNQEEHEISDMYDK